MEMGLSLSPASPAPLPPVEPEATFFIRYDRKGRGRRRDDNIHPVGEAKEPKRRAADARCPTRARPAVCRRLPAYSERAVPP